MVVLFLEVFALGASLGAVLTLLVLLAAGLWDADR